MATTALLHPRRRRWLPPLVAVAVLCVASLAVAFVIGHVMRPAWRWVDHISAEVDRAPRAELTGPVSASPARGSTALTPRATAASVAAPANSIADLSASGPPPDEESAREPEQAPSAERAPMALPTPIVLHVEPPIEVGENGAAGANSGVRAATSASAAPSASTAPSASAAQASVPCGSAQCAPGKVCCNASCGTCVNPGERCSQLVCGMPILNESQSCGFATCNVGEICCNTSCGTCIHPGDACDATRRCADEITFPDSQSCGMQTCNVGTVCCNPSCGICAAPGEPCSQSACR